MSQNQIVNQQGTEVATLGGGCFWCIEAVFADLTGVEKVESGYAGGRNANPTYREVCSGTTGHAEVIQVTFDPQKVSYREILEVFFSVHDPTTLNRQGGDVGTQYRSVIFYHTEEQKTVAEEQKTVAERVINELNHAKMWNSPIVTEITPIDKFYKAEDYHQEYFKLHGEEPYCRVVIAPKLSKFRQHYGERLKT